MSWSEVGRSACPIARGLSVIGERWTLLIMSEIAIGVHRFDDISAQTGVSPHLLATRLKQLEAEGIVSRHPYSSRPMRYEYHATPKGRELDPILLAIRAWGLKWGGYGPDEPLAIKVVDKRTGAEISENIHVLGDSRVFSFEHTENTMSLAYAAEREARRAAFMGKTRRS